MISRTLKTVSVADIEASDDNPRKTFNDAELAELAASVKALGILQPLVVRSLGRGKGYKLIAGERRLRAAKLAKLSEVPVTVIKANDRQALEAAIAENETRVDVSLVEKAEGYHRLMTDHGATLDDIAKQIGKSASTVRAILKIRALPEQAREALADGRISPAVAGLIASRPTEELRERAAAWALEETWNGPRTFKNVKEYVQTHLSRELKGAPFDTKSKKLVPDTPSCKDCPKRTGNMEDCEPGTRADVCTDPVCFAGKVKAHVDTELVKAGQAGHTILTDSQAAKLFPTGEWMAPNAPYYPWGEGCYLVRGKEGSTFEALFEKYVLPADLCVCLDGRLNVRFLIAKARAAELADLHYGGDLLEKPKPAKPTAPTGPAVSSQLEVIDLQGRDILFGLKARALANSAFAEAPQAVRELLYVSAVAMINDSDTEDTDRVLEMFGLTDGVEPLDTDIVIDHLSGWDVADLAAITACLAASRFAFAWEPEDRACVEKWFAAGDDKGGDQ